MKSNNNLQIYIALKKIQFLHRISKTLKIKTMKDCLQRNHHLYTHSINNDGIGRQYHNITLAHGCILYNFSKSFYIPKHYSIELSRNP